MGKERPDLKNEAIKIDGSYIEDMIAGYTTLKTSKTSKVAESLMIKPNDYEED